MSELATMPTVLTIEEAAGVLRIGRSAAYDAARRGDLPVIRVGRCLRVPRHRLEQMLGVNEQRPGGEILGVAKTADAGGGRAPD